MRRLGYEQACVSYNIEPVVLQPDSWDSRDGYDVMRAAAVCPRASRPRTTSWPWAPCATSTRAGEWCLATVRVVGFDDIDGADSYAPPLTTIHQPFDRLGRTAVRLVRSLMGGGPSQDIVLDPELVIRASSHL